MKLSKDILQKIKQIEIRTRRLLSGTHIGEYASAQKGSGLEFEQIREYTQGDDIRFIDWKATARTQKLLVKEYIEERSRTVMLLVDMSGSMGFGSIKHLKSHVAAELASVLALAANYGKDHVGAIVCHGDKKEKVFPAKSGKQHVHAIMQELFESDASGVSSLYQGLKSLISLQRSDAVVFIVSDFMEDEGYQKLLKVAARKHDVVALRCIDPLEREFPSCGLLSVQDPETKSNDALRSSKDLNKFLKTRLLQQESMLKKCGVDVLDIMTDRPYVGQVVRFFKKRMQY